MQLATIPTSPSHLCTPHYPSTRIRKPRTDNYVCNTRKETPKPYTVLVQSYEQSAIYTGIPHLSSRLYPYRSQEAPQRKGKNVGNEGHYALPLAAAILSLTLLLAAAISSSKSPPPVSPYEAVENVLSTGDGEAPEWPDEGEG